MITGGGSRCWIDEDDELVVVKGLGFFWYWSLTKLITTFWSDREESVLVVWGWLLSSSRRTDVFLIVYENFKKMSFRNTKKITLVKDIFSVDWLKLLLVLLLLRIVTKVVGPTAKIFFFFSSWILPVVAAEMNYKIKELFFLL